MTALCPSEATILAFLDGTIAPEQRVDVEAHLSSCTVCGEVAVWVAADMASPSRAPGHEGRPFMGSLAAGATVGRYQVLGAVGRGGMGEVYAAYHPDLDRRIALKVVSAARAGSAARWSRLLREARTLARLSHPNIISVYDAGTVGDGVYVAMEFVEGQTLDQWLRAAPRDWRAILDVFAAAGAGLTAAHAAQIVHRDFKPQNVMIGNDGRVRVMDFGLARTGVEPEAPTTDVDAAASSPPNAHRDGRGARHARVHGAGAVPGRARRRPLGPVQLLRRPARGAVGKSPAPPPPRQVFGLAPARASASLRGCAPSFNAGSPPSASSAIRR